MDQAAPAVGIGLPRATSSCILSQRRRRTESCPLTPWGNRKLIVPGCLGLPQGGIDPVVVFPRRVGVRNDNGLSETTFQLPIRIDHDIWGVGFVPSLFRDEVTVACILQTGQPRRIRYDVASVGVPDGVPLGCPPFCADPLVHLTSLFLRLIGCKTSHCLPLSVVRQLPTRELRHQTFAGTGKCARTLFACPR